MRWPCVKVQRLKETISRAKDGFQRIMNLDEAQRQKVSEWIKQGLKLSEIQNRLGSELGVRMTYMEVRLLVDDLKLTPKDIEPAKPPPSLGGNVGTAAKTATAGKPGAAPAPTPAPAAGSLSVSVDQLARPGALVSGKVTFKDGNRAEWYLDQTGRLGLVPEKAGYRPPATEVQEFQMALETELSKIGF
jgi:hypothetical protein